MDEGNSLSLKLQGIINTAIDGIITISSRGIIEGVNPAALKIFQYEEVDLIGKNVKILMPSNHSKSHDQYISRYLATRKAQIIGIGREVEGLKKDGTLFPFRLAVSEVILHDRIIFTGIIHDLTEVKIAETKLKRLNAALEEEVSKRTQELESTINQLLSTNQKLAEREQELKVALEKEMELNELKSRFVSTASHEFRTPLSTILSSASLILRYQGADTQERRAKHVSRIKKAVTNLTGILNDFLSLSKIEEGKEKVNLEAVKIPELCYQTIDELEGILKSEQKIFSSFNDHNLEFVTDAKILKNILFNLISNAIKYSQEGSTIECNFKRTEETFEIQVKDEGIGIPLIDQKHMFQRFFRASNVEGIQGTGLGLNIVKKYVELLNGVITLESEEGIGTTVTIKFPKV